MLIVNERIKLIFSRFSWFKLPVVEGMVVLPCRLLWAVLFIDVLWLARSISVKLLSELLTEAIQTPSLANTHRLKDIHRGVISERCDEYDESIKSRIGCCYPNDSKLLFNVMIQHNRLVVFIPSDSKQTISNEELKLPPIKSLQKQATSLFNMEVEVRRESFPRNSCKSVYNGTLHVVGRSSANNVYHTSKFYYLSDSSYLYD